MIPLPNKTPQQGTNFQPQAPSSNMISPPRVDFDRNRFDVLIAQKGVDCLVEKALQCPCKTHKVNQLSSCKNCGGTGWIFVNPRKSRMVLQGMDFKNTEEVWSRLVHGVLKITAVPEEELGYMDRITRLNARSIFSEIVEFEEFGGDIFGFLSYQPIEVDYIGIYVSDSDKLQTITKNQFTITNSRIDINEDVELPDFDANNPLTATIRYIHAPTFNIIEHQREIVENLRWDGNKEVIQFLPTLALARRTHDVDDLVNLRQGRLNDNSYQEDKCRKENSNYFKPVCNY